MDDLRKEFDEWMSRSKDDCCDTNQEEEPEEEFPDYVIELTTVMLVPKRCGIYFSKRDLRRVGLENDISISLKQRIRMLTDLLKSIFDVEEMKKMFASFYDIIDERIAIYEELSNASESAKDHFQTHIKKAKALKDRLDRIIKDSSVDQ